MFNEFVVYERPSNAEKILSVFPKKSKSSSKLLDILDNLDMTNEAQ